MKIKEYYKLKKNGFYKHKIGEFEFYDDDIFTRDSPNNYTIHNGICMIGIEIPDEDLDFYPDKTVTMEIL